MTTEEQLMKIATMVCCPLCDEAKCVGRYKCSEIKDWIERKLIEEGKNE